MDTVHRVALIEKLTGLAALAGVGVFWQPAHPNEPAPLLILRSISDQRGATHAGDDGLRTCRLQVDCFAADDGEAQTLREAVLSSLHGFAGELTESGPRFDSCLHDGGFDDFDETARLTRASADFLIQYPVFPAS